MWLLASSDTRSMREVITSILQRLGDDIDPNNLPQILVFFMILYIIYYILKIELTCFQLFPEASRSNFYL